MEKIPMPFERDTRATDQEKGSFQQPIAVPCESCSACGLCEITTTTIDFVGNLSDLANVDDADKPKLEMLFAMAGFEQKIQNWDESIGEKGKFEFTRFGRTFKGELSKNRDLKLTVTLAQNPKAMMEKFNQAQKTVVTHPTEIPTHAQQSSAHVKTHQTEKQREAIAQAPIVEQKAEGITPTYDRYIVADTDGVAAGEYTVDAPHEYHQQEITEAHRDQISFARENDTDTQETQHMSPDESKVERTVLPSTTECIQWQNEKPFEDWEIIPIQSAPFFGGESITAVKAIHTESVREVIPLEKYPDSDVFDGNISISSPQKQLRTEPGLPYSIPDRENVLSMVETHKHAEREMFNFISEIHTAIEKQETTDMISEARAQETTIPIDIAKPAMKTEVKEITFAPSNQSEHVIMQYLIAAKAHMQLASGRIEFQSQQESARGISVKKHVYSISHSGNEYTISLVVKKDTKLEILGTLEALRALGIILLELQLAQTKHTHTEIPDTQEMETAPEELSPVMTQTIQIPNVDEYVYFLRYVLWMAISDEIEKSQLLHVCL